MGFIILSHDVTTGTIYNGTWTLSRPVSGIFKLMSQYIYPQDYYWMWPDNNQMVLRFRQGTNEYIAVVVLPTTYTNTQEWANVASSWLSEIQTVLDQIVSDSDGDISSLEATLTSYNTYFALAFTGSIDASSIYWADPNSTSSVVFNKTANETSPINTYILNYSSKMTSSPEILECVIEESSGQTLTTHGTAANLIFKTTGEYVSGQTINIRNSTNTLTIKFFSDVDSVNPIPLQHNWHMFFQ